MRLLIRLAILQVIITVLIISSVALYLSTQMRSTILNRALNFIKFSIKAMLLILLPRPFSLLQINRQLMRQLIVQIIMRIKRQRRILLRGIRDNKLLARGRLGLWVSFIILLSIFKVLSYSTLNLNSLLAILSLLIIILNRIASL